MSGFQGWESGNVIAFLSRYSTNSGILGTLFPEQKHANPKNLLLVELILAILSESHRSSTKYSGNHQALTLLRH